MMRLIDFGDNIIITMRKNIRARRIRVVIHRGRSVTTTLPFFVSYHQGEQFLRENRLWIVEKVQLLDRSKGSFLSRGTKEEYDASRIPVKKLIEERLHFFQTIYNVSWERVSVRNQKTRWGSCSRKKNLSFSYRLLFLPEHLRDYVIVHEMCHLREMNHSAKFWALVALTFPDYKELRKEMKEL